MNLHSRLWNDGNSSNQGESALTTNGFKLICYSVTITDLPFIKPNNLCIVWVEKFTIRRRFRRQATARRLQFTRSQSATFIRYNQSDDALRERKPTVQRDYCVSISQFDRSHASLLFCNLFCCCNVLIINSLCRAAIIKYAISLLWTFRQFWCINCVRTNRILLVMYPTLPSVSFRYTLKKDVEYQPSVSWCSISSV